MQFATEGFVFTASESHRDTLQSALAWSSRGSSDGMVCGPDHGPGVDVKRLQPDPGSPSPGLLHVPYSLA